MAVDVAEIAAARRRGVDILERGEHFVVEFRLDFVRGKERPRITGGHAYTPEATAASECIAWCAYEDACREKYGCTVTAPEGVPVMVMVAAFGTMPAGRPKRDGNAEAFVVTPDADNIGKLVLDALNPKREGRGKNRLLTRVGAWADDKQVTRLDVRKVARIRGKEPSTHVVVRWPYEQGVPDGK